MTNPNGPPIEDRPPDTGKPINSLSSHHANHDRPQSSAHPAETSGKVQGSQQVSWWETHRFIEAVLAQANLGPLPWAGTPTWCELSDGDPRKLLAIAIAGEHHVLRVEACQEARAQASHAISAAADWTQISREIRQLNDFHATRPWLRRRPS
jgi:hypothetical protein